MSYFPSDHDESLLVEDACNITADEQQIEVADGVTVERRSVLWLSAGAVGSLLAGAGGLGAQDPERPNSKPAEPGLGYAEFLEQIYPLAQRVVAAQGKDEEAYLLTVAAAMTRLRDPASPLRQTMQAFRKKHRASGKRLPISAMLMNLREGRGFSHHDHLNYNGVIMGVKGEVRIRNYDFVGKAPAVSSRETFRIRETRDDLIRPGRISTLGRQRENIHDVVAGKGGATVLDVFTFFDNPAGSRYLDVEKKPRDAEARIYDAAWRPRRRRR